MYITGALEFEKMWGEGVAMRGTGAPELSR